MYKVIPDLEESSEELSWYLLSNEKGLGTAISRAMEVSPLGTCRVVERKSSAKLKQLKRELKALEEDNEALNDTIITLRKDLSNHIGQIRAVKEDYDEANEEAEFWRKKFAKEEENRKYWTKRYWAVNSKLEKQLAETKQQLALPLNTPVEVQQKVEEEQWGFTCRPSLEDLEIIRLYRPLLYDAVCLRCMDDGTIVTYKNVGGALGVSPARARELVNQAFRVLYWHKQGKPLKPYKPRWSVNAASIQ